MIVLSVILSECDVSFPAIVNVFALSSTAAMMPLKGVARTLPPGEAAAEGDASASVELLASGEEGFFPAASVGNGKQMTTVAKNAAIITKLFCFMCRESCPLNVDAARRCIL